MKIPADDLAGPGYYPDQNQRHAGCDPDNEDEPNGLLSRHGTFVLLAPRLNFRATFREWL
jgi:hypothetical protein